MKMKHMLIKQGPHPHPSIRSRGFIALAGANVSQGAKLS